MHHTYLEGDKDMALVNITCDFLQRELSICPCLSGWHTLKKKTDPVQETARVVPVGSFRSGIQKCL
jgi:hypothetical protein